MSAGRYPPAPDRTGYRAQETGAKGTGDGSPPGRRSPGLAPGVLGWPWHPGRLATTQYRGDAIDQMLFLPAHPFWSAMIIAVDVAALYGLCAYGSRSNLAG